MMSPLLTIVWALITIIVLGSIWFIVSFTPPVFDQRKYWKELWDKSYIPYEHLDEVVSYFDHPKLEAEDRVKLGSYWLGVGCRDYWIQEEGYGAYKLETLDYTDWDAAVRLAKWEIYRQQSDDNPCPGWEGAGVPKERAMP